MKRRHTTTKGSRAAKATALALGTLLTAGAAQAEIVGIMNGRSAAPPSWQTAVEGAAQFDDDFFWLGVRGNYALSDTTTVFANISRADIDNGGDGFAFGGGSFFHLTEQRMLPNLDIALKPSVSYLDADGGSIFGVAGEFLVSGRATVNQERVGWYGNLGLGFFRADPDNGDSDTDLEPIIGGGVTVPFGPGTAYVGVDIIDDVQLGAGYRYPLQ